MKQKLIELLATKFGVGAKVVEGIADKLSKTVSTDEEATTAIEGVTFQQVLESYADKRANEASETARKNAIKTYETQYGLKDGKPTKTEGQEPPKQEPPKPQEAGNEVPQYVKDLQTSNASMLTLIKELQGSISSLRTEKRVESRQSVLKKEISALTEAQQKPYSRIALDAMSDDDFDTFMEETRNNVAAIKKDNDAAKAAQGNPRPFVGNMPASGKKATDAELDNVVKQIGFK